MSTLSPPAGSTGPSLDVQVLQGLETYITTEKFLHTLEAASAEWIDLSDHQQHPHKGWSPPSSSCELELQQVQQQSASSQQESTQHSSEQPSTSRRSSFLGRWRWSGNSNAPATTTSSSGMVSAPDSSSSGAAAASSSSDTAGTTPSSSSPSPSSKVSSAAVAATTTTFELVEPQGPLTESLRQEPFVLVSSEDAIEGMAYYIALYLSRAPEARNMEPKQLQAALRQTMTAIRRSRYRAIWDWGRCLYRWGAVSYSALQLYEHPWLVRAVVAGVWASSKMAFGVLF